MYAVISKLDLELSSRVKSLWQQLCITCGLKEIFLLPTPHFTWFLTEEMDVQKVVPLIEQIALTNSSFSTHTFGLGIFTGEKPVLYLPIVKTEALIHLHNDLWTQIQPYSDEIQSYYSPLLWVPHITLALKDLTRETLVCAVNEIAFEPIELLVRVDNIALAVYENEKTSETLHTFQMKSE